MLERKTVSQCTTSDYCKGWNDAVDAMPKWISVEERLPEPDKDVLTLYYGKYRCIGYYSEDCKLWIINDAPVYDEGVDHWMPLPPKPENTITPKEAD